MARDVFIVPRSGSIRFRTDGAIDSIISASAGDIIISGSGNVGIATSPSYPLHVYSSGSTIFSVEGSQGTLFQIRDSFVGTLFEVNDISGIPVLSVAAEDTVTMGTFGDYTLHVTGSYVGIGTSQPATADSLNSHSLHVWNELSASAFYGDGSNLTGITGVTGSTSASFADYAMSSSHTLYANNADSASVAISASHAMNAYWTASGGEIHRFGNVGIGTTNPIDKLDVRGGYIVTDNTQGYRIRNAGGTALWAFYAGADDVLQVGSGTWNDMKFYVTDATVKMWIEGSTGHIGIGTITPDERLTVHGNAHITGALDVDGIITAPEIHVGFVSASIIYSTGSNKFGDDASDIHQFTGSIRQSGSAYNYFRSSVGIGTTNPAQLVHIIKDQSANTQVMIANPNAGAATTAQLEVSNAATDNSSVRLIALGTGYTTAGAYVQDGGILSSESDLSGGLSILARHASGVIRFYTAGHENERMRIDASGNVGIGTTAPAVTGLHVWSNVSASAFYGEISQSVPAAPTDVTLADNADDISVSFSASATPGINEYEVWRAEGGAQNAYSLMGLVKEDSIIDPMTIIDNSFTISGSLDYRVYATKAGRRSVAATAAVSSSASAADVSNLDVVNMVEHYYIQYDVPNDRRFASVTIKKDAELVEGDLTEAAAVQIYSGRANSYMYAIPEADLEKYHQFWVYTVTNT